MIKDRIHTFLSAVALAFAVAFTLSSCGSDAELLRSELGGIAEFFTLRAPTKTEETDNVSHSKIDEASAPLLKTSLHREALPSVYVPEVVYTEVAESETLGYVAVPHFSSNNMNTVCTELALYGITPQIVTRRDPSPAGDVYAIEYAGLSDSGRYYMNPDCTVTLYVSAAKPELPARAEDSSNVVYLTFDDGPTYSETIRLLDVLDSYGVKATFFVTGEAVQSYPASARAIAERGHSLGCHSVTHVYDDIYASTESLEGELLLWEELVSAAGIETDDLHRLFRFPGGSNNAAIGGTDEAERMKAMLSSHSYRIYDWNVVTNDAVLYTAPYGTDTYDYIRETFDSTFEARVATGEPPIIILMHETVSETIDLLPWMLESLIERGYTFSTLDTIDSWVFGIG